MFCAFSNTIYVEFNDGVKEGDGDRVFRVWKYLLLLFCHSGRTKYALEALTLQLQCNGLLQNVAFDIKWSRFVTMQKEEREETFLVIFTWNI